MKPPGRTNTGIRCKWGVNKSEDIDFILLYYYYNLRELDGLAEKRKIFVYSSSAAGFWTAPGLIGVTVDLVSNLEQG